MSRTALVLVSVLFAFFATAHAGPTPARPGYYGLEFYDQLEQGLENEDLILKLNEILKGGHVPGPQGFDTVVPNCSGQSGCTMHTSLGYKVAREKLFGQLHLEQIAGLYSVTELYCETAWTERQDDIGPGKIPSTEAMNTEHTWPQSRFTGRYPKDVQKCDLHHLFPTDTKMNAHRSSLRFGEVAKDMEKLKCANSRLGHSTGGGTVFEPPEKHKGNVARAIFYFATRYQMKIENEEEQTMRLWDQQDPVDEQESIRNEEIFKVQKTRNPFIDFPELARKINDF